MPGKAPYFPAFPACLFLSLRFIHSYSHFPVYISGGQRENFPDFRRFSPIVKTLKNLLVNNCEQTCELPCSLSISVPLFRRNLSSAAGKKRETRADCSGFPVSHAFSIYLLYIFQDLHPITCYPSVLLPRPDNPGVHRNLPHRYGSLPTWTPVLRRPCRRRTCRYREPSSPFQ